MELQLFLLTLSSTDKMNEGLRSFTSFSTDFPSARAKIFPMNLKCSMVYSSIVIDLISENLMGELIPTMKPMI